MHLWDAAEPALRARTPLRADILKAAYQTLANRYVATARLDGWTPAQFMAALASHFWARPRAAKTLDGYRVDLAEVGLVAYGRGTRRKIERVFLPGLVEQNGGLIGWQRRVAERRATDRDRQAAWRARQRPDRPGAARAGIAPLVPGEELDRIDLELANLAAKMAPAVASRLTHSDLPAANGPASPTTLPAIERKKQIPQTPRQAGGWPMMAAQEEQEAIALAPSDDDENDEADGGGGGSGPSPQPPASPPQRPQEGLEDLAGRLCRAVGGGAQAQAQLKQQMPQLYGELCRQHPYGIGQHGLGGLSADELGQICRQVARRHQPPPEAAPPSVRRRCARYRRQVDRQGAAATASDLAQALKDTLGPAGAATVRAHGLAAVGLSLATAELVLERVCRGLRFGSTGPTQLRHPKALQAYLFTSFRRARGHGRGDAR